MAEFNVTARIIVNVEMTIEAESANEARSIFNSSIGMTAKLYDFSEDRYDVHDEDIEDITDLDIEADDDETEAA